MPSPAALPVESHAATPSTPQPSGWWAVCLCAAWCGTCTEYRTLFDTLAQAHPDVRFEWVDIEDESELVGDLDVETFPTLLIADGRKAHFLGPLLPQAAVLERLLATLRSGAPSGAATDSIAQEVFDRVCADRTVVGA